jgi:Zn-dependent peptidase ImmA (M78 family)
MIPSEYASQLAPYMVNAPTDVARAADALGLKVYALELPKGISGILKHDRSYSTPSEYVIFVDSKEPAVRQRFTAAHEIGHFLLHRDSIHGKVEDNYLLRAHGMSNRQEVEANEFAADLLMPWQLINQAMDSGITSVDDLANHFKVSRLAMGIRLGLPT